MSCLYPLTCWRGKPNEKGKRPIVFRRADSYQVKPGEDVSLQVPCGKCLGCKADEAMSWAIRCHNEASLHKQSCFVTLTYNDENLPPTLVKRDLQNFFRHIRDQGQKIRYLACGEYGDSTNRPHYHACIFGTDFRNGTEFSVNDELYAVPGVSEIWGKGNVLLAEFNMATACYTAGYVVKKNREKKDDSFRIMSRRPGLGVEWLAKHWPDVLRTKSIVVEGKELPCPPSYIRKAQEVAEKIEGPSIVSVLEPVKQARLDRFMKMDIEKRIDKHREARAKAIHINQKVQHQKQKEKI